MCYNNESEAKVLRSRRAAADLWTRVVMWPGGHLLSHGVGGRQGVACWLLCFLFGDAFPGVSAGDCGGCCGGSYGGYGVATVIATVDLSPTVVDTVLFFVHRWRWGCPFWWAFPSWLCRSSGMCLSCYKTLVQQLCMSPVALTLAVLCWCLAACRCRLLPIPSPAKLGENAAPLLQ